MINVAARIVQKLGGAQIVAQILGVDPSNVHRWTYSKNRGGTGGVIPTRHQQRLLEEAKKRGIDLMPDDFFEAPSAPKTKGKAA